MNVHFETHEIKIKMAFAKDNYILQLHWVICEGGADKINETRI